MPAVLAGDFVFTAGQLPMRAGMLLATGLVGADLPVEMARECAATCVLNALAAASTVCDLDAVASVAKFVCYVASAKGFTAQPAVADGGSAVLASAFGSLGGHAREAVGVVELPMGAAVEASLVLSLR